MSFTIGEWVVGSTNQGELIQGFIESIQPAERTLGIFVVDSDNDQAVGKEVRVRNYGIKKIPDGSYENEEQVKAVIDLALQAKDAAWFAELSDKLTELRNAASVRNHEVSLSASVRNRLGYSSAK